MTAESKHSYTLEKYFALELDSEEKFEYWDGNVWTMSGASIRHNTIVLNISGELRTGLRNSGCRAFSSDARIYVPSYPPYRYPDVSALCGKLEIKTMSGLEMLMNPQLIVEVLSDSTEGFDRGDKFGYYKSIPSFCEYLLVSQKRPYVSQFIKERENVWTNVDYNDLEATIELRFTDYRLALSEIYRDVAFDEQLEIVRLEQ